MGQTPVSQIMVPPGEVLSQEMLKGNIKALALIIQKSLARLKF